MSCRKWKCKKNGTVCCIVDRLCSTINRIRYNNATGCLDGVPWVSVRNMIIITSSIVIIYSYFHILCSITEVSVCMIYNAALDMSTTAVPKRRESCMYPSSCIQWDYPIEGHRDDVSNPVHSARHSARHVMICVHANLVTVILSNVETVYQKARGRCVYPTSQLLLPNSEEDTRVPFFFHITSPCRLCDFLNGQGKWISITW
jgi:hypothetical protein